MIFQNTPMSWVSLTLSHTQERGERRKANYPKVFQSWSWNTESVTKPLPLQHSNWEWNSRDTHVRAAQTQLAQPPNAR